MISIEIHQRPQFENNGKEVLYIIGTEDTWTVNLRNGEMVHELQVFDGFPLFSKRADKSNQFDKAITFAKSMVLLLELNANSIKVFKGKDSKWYTYFLRECEKQIELKRERLQRQLAEIS